MTTLKAKPTVAVTHSGLLGSLQGRRSALAYQHPFGKSQQVLRCSACLSTPQSKTFCFQRRDD